LVMSPMSHAAGPGAITVHDVRLESREGALCLSAAVRSGDPALPERLWFRVPESVTPSLAADASAFIPVLLPIAMQRRGALHLDAPVASGAVAGARRVASLLQRWSDRLGDGLGEAAIDAAAEVEVKRGREAGAFFSAGVDAFYTLLRNQERFPAGDSRRVSRLVVMHGFDLSLQETAVHGALLRAADSVAAELGLEVVPLATNARDFLRPFDWDRYGFGLVQAAVTAALAEVLHTMFVPSGGRPFAEMAVKPFSGGPEVFAHWSSGPVEMVYDPLHVARAEKIRYLSSSPLALAHLRVCWENREGRYNCGRCEKCLRTMLTLRVTGALEHCPTLPRRVEPRAILALHAPPKERRYWHLVIAELRAARVEGELVEAVEQMLRRSQWSESLLGRIDDAASRALRAVGLSASRLAAIDRRLLGGAATRSLRALQRVAARRSS